MARRCGPVGELEDVSSFTRYLQNEVKARVRDSESGFDSDLMALATTEMQTEALAEFLNSVPAVDPWEIGEALAECVLVTETEATICWPWNSVADRRTPRASLPGADLVGFLIENDDVWFLFGEVKTSSDESTPPNVMYGKGGMTWQLEQEYINQSIQLTLLKWLYSRCIDETNRSLYSKAAKRFVSSCCKDFRLYGILLRDTVQSDLDLSSRGEHLGKTIAAPATATLIAYYLPIKIEEWSSALDGGST